MIFIKYTRFNSLWKRISAFFEEHWFLNWLITLVSIIGGSIIFTVFIASLYIDKTTDIKESNKTLYKHVIAVERTYGVTDSIIFHDVNTGAEVKLQPDKKLIITTKGVNWLGASIDNNITIDNTKGFKIIK